MKNIEVLQQKVANAGLDFLYLRNTTNIKWATEFKKVFDSEAAHGLLVSATEAYVHTDSRYSTAMQKAAKGTNFVVSQSCQHHFSYLLSLLDKFEDKSLRIGIETTISLEEYRLLERLSEEFPLTIELVETEQFVEELRQVKNGFEIETMKKAQAITDAGFAHICNYIKPGMTEKQVQLELDTFMFDKGADELAFSTIVAAGSHAASPHAIPSDRVIEKGDCVLFDFGAKYQDYCSDMTRCVFMGEPSAELRQAWNLLRSVNETCEAAICEGVPAADVHNLAEKLLAEGGYEGCMGHSLGHSVGIDIHESPNLSPRDTSILAAGNVVTVEPGIYIPDKFGMRLEDFGVVTQDGYDVFTQSSHEIVIIKC